MSILSMAASRAIGRSNAGALPIRVEGVSKRFEGTVALNDITVAVPAGAVLGLLGPNGAGKTTLIRTILDIIKPDSGRVEIFGRPLTPAVRDSIGYLPEERGLYPRQPVGRVLEYLGCLKGMTAAEARGQASLWLERFGLAEAGAKRVEQLSKGNQQKVQLAATLMARPQIVFLDEPLSGLDPVGARVIHTVIREMAAEGRTVLDLHPPDEHGGVAVHTGVDARGGACRPRRRAAGNQGPLLEPCHSRALDGRLSRLPLR